MSKLFQNMAFSGGFLFGVFVVIVLNIYTIYREGVCGTASQYIGFPLHFYERYSTNCESVASDSVVIGCYLSHFSWFGAFVDVLTAITFGFIVGFVYKFDRERFPPR